MNRIHKPAAHCAALGPEVREAIASDQSDPIAASNPRRWIAVLIAVPCLNIGYWLAWPGLQLSAFGHHLMLVCLKRKRFFQKN